MMMQYLKDVLYIPGFSRITQLLLNNGATTAVVNCHGELYQCMEYQGIQVLLETERRRHTSIIMHAIRDRRALTKLRQPWLVSINCPFMELNQWLVTINCPFMELKQCRKVTCNKWLADTFIY